MRKFLDSLSDGEFRRLGGASLVGAAEKEVGAGTTGGSDQEGVGEGGWDKAGWSASGAVIRLIFS